MRTEPRIDVQRKGEQGKNALLHRGEWRQMPPRVSALMDDGQRHLLKRGQEAFGRRLGRGPRGLPRVDPGQDAPVSDQPTADHELQQRQDPQAHGEQSDQAGDMILALHIHGGQRQRLPLQPPEPPAR
jgi:hypothetical protein